METPDGSFPIEHVSRAAYKSVSALMPTADASLLKTQEVPLAAYTLGKHSEHLLRIGTAGGSVVLVTENHPMITEEGDVIPARSVYLEQRLLTRAGPQAVESLQSVDFEGVVWGLDPKSSERIKNTILVEGIWTGAAKFQNQWADDHHRLSLRMESAAP